MNVFVAALIVDERGFSDIRVLCFQRSLYQFQPMGFCSSLDLLQSVCKGINEA